MDKISLPLEKAHRIISPRLVYLVTTVDKKGRVNAAPFSSITSVSKHPQRLVLAVSKPADTIKNIRATREFVVNVPSKKLLNQVWICGDKYSGTFIPRGVNELEIAGLTSLPSENVAPPRIAECTSHAECRVVWIKNAGDHYLVLADILAASCTEGIFSENYIQDLTKTQPLFEISSGFFTSTGEVFEPDREKTKETVVQKLKYKNVF